MVVVDVHHPRIWVDLLGDLVRVVRRGQPGPDVDELAHPVAPRQIPHSPPKEPPVGHSSVHDLGPLAYYLARDLTVRLEVILPIQPDVIDARRVRHRGIE
jgi:hypothetical protein